MMTSQPDLDGLRGRLSAPPQRRPQHPIATGELRLLGVLVRVQVRGQPQLEADFKAPLSVDIALPLYAATGTSATGTTRQQTALPVPSPCAVAVFRRNPYIILQIILRLFIVLNLFLTCNVLIWVGGVKIRC